jgi:hypothetical protein
LQVIGRPSITWATPPAFIFLHSHLPFPVFIPYADSIFYLMQFLFCSWSIYMMGTILLYFIFYFPKSANAHGILSVYLSFFLNL